MSGPGKIGKPASAGSGTVAKGRRAPVIVGWREHVFLPSFGCGLPAKIDSGARTCALHVESYEISTTDTGTRIARIEFRPPDTRQSGYFEFELADQRRVKSSSGHEEERPVIALPIRLGTRTVTAETTLTSRSNLEFPMLVGRNLLRKGFLVDVRRSFLTDADFKLD